MDNHTHTFPKAEHLTSKLQIDSLFEKGEGFIAFPLRVVYQLVPKEENSSLIKVVVSVPKKRFKHAVDRNRFKRLIRESYRLNKHQLWAATEQTPWNLHIAFCAVSNELPNFDTVQIKMQMALVKLEHRILQKRDKNS